MSYPLACLTIVAAALFGGLASLTVGHLIADRRTRYRDFGGKVFQQVGIMFSVLLSFVFSEVWSQYDIAAQAISRECAALHAAAILADTIPDRGGASVERAILEYVRTTVNIEWPAMAQRRSSPEASKAFRHLFEQTSMLPAARPSDLGLRTQILSLIAEAHSYREVRLFQITAASPAFIWGVLIAMAVIVDGFLLFAGTDTRSHLFLAAAAAGCTAAGLVMVKMFDHPFEGALGIPSDDLVRLMGHVAEIV